MEALFDRLPEPLIAVREVATGGRSTARLDDLATTASRLADEVGPLVEIHGQHDQQRLLDERWQRDLLDAFGGHEAARAAMADAVERWRANRAALAELAIDPRELARRVDLLEHEAAEIAAARLRPGEADEIRARLAAAQHGEAIARGAAAVHEALTADGAGARESTALAVREARGLARLDPRFEPLAERLAGLEAELDDVAAEIRDLADGDRARPGRRWPRSRSASARSTPSSAATATARRRSSPTASGPPPSWSGCAASTTSGPGASARTPRCSAEVAAAAAALSEAAPDGRRPPWPPRSATSSRSSASRPASSRSGSAAGRPAADEPAIELDGDAVAFDASGADQVVYRLAPNPASRPGRWPGSRRAASCRASRWRSSRSWPRPTRRRSSSSTRSTPGSAAGARTRSGAACGPWRAATRSCASPTCRRSPPTPTPSTGSPSASATAGR